jgi:Domain of unknown function (DUF5666)
MRQAPFSHAWPVALALALAACGGGGGGSDASGGSGGGTSGPSGTSSGAITAFGSVFVNGHEFGTASAQVMDDDTGDTSGRVSDLEVGQVVDVDPASSSTSAAPVAQWLHVHPLARGYVDAADSTANTIGVMGQTVSLDSGTLFSDHRACVGASTNPCTAVTDASGLATTASAGGGTTPGSYVTVDGYLFSSAAGSAQIVATLVSVRDAPSGSFPAAFKVEGVVSATTAAGATAGVTIGGLAISLDHATCRVGGHSTACASAFAAGDVVSVFSATAPALPATAFDATIAIERKHLPVQTAGAAVEFDGRVSASTPASGSTAATFVVRGVTVDTSALPAGTSLPAVGDLVRVAGTVSTDGLSVTASAIKILHAARSVSYAFAGDVTAVAAGSASGTFDVTVLGQTIVVSSQTRLSDRQSWQWFDRDPQSNPFNITTFQTYLAASASQHVAVKAAKDSSGVLQALSLSIWPASSFSEVAGPVDATPAPVAAAASAPATFSIDGVAVSAAAGAIHFQHHGGSAIAAGDEVVASGTFAANVLGVAATQGMHNFVIDFGAPRGDGDDDAPLY